VERAQVVTESQFVEALRGVDQHVAFGREPGKDIHLMKKRHVLDIRASGFITGSRLRIGRLSMRQNETTGAPVRSEPKLGNAWENLPSSNAATESISAAVTTPCPPDHGSGSGTRVRLALSALGGADQRGQVRQTARVTRLVVVPSENFHQVALSHGEPESKTHEAGELTMSLDTRGSSEYSSSPAISPRRRRCDTRHLSRRRSASHAASRPSR